MFFRSLKFCIQLFCSVRKFAPFINMNPMANMTFVLNRENKILCCWTSEGTVTHS